MKKVVYGLLVVILLASLAVSACAKPAPAPAPTPTPTPTPAPGGTTPTTGPTPLEQVIAGAKKEGTVTLRATTKLTPKSWDRARSEIKQKYGFDLDIKATPGGDMAKDLADALAEYKAGATPTFDVMHGSESEAMAGLAAGVYEKVDWKSLMTKDMNPEVALQLPSLFGGIVYYTVFSLGVLYNPDKVAEDEFPKTFADLANPKWKGKVGLGNYSWIAADYAYMVGKEKFYDALRRVMANGALADSSSGLATRYALGETWLDWVNSSWAQTLRVRGMSAKWRAQEVAYASHTLLMVRTGAAHPNAAKLVALYLASPAGAKLVVEEAGAGNRYYPGSPESDIQLENQKYGIRELSAVNFPELQKFRESGAYIQWQKEIDLIFKTGK